MCSACKGQKRELGSLIVELQAISIYPTLLLGIELDLWKKSKYTFNFEPSLWSRPWTPDPAALVLGLQVCPGEEQGWLCSAIQPAFQVLMGNWRVPGSSWVVIPKSKKAQPKTKAWGRLGAPSCSRTLLHGSWVGWGGSRFMLINCNAGGWSEFTA